MVNRRDHTALFVKRARRLGATVNPSRTRRYGKTDMNTTTAWPSEAYCVNACAYSPAQLAAEVYRRTCRTTLDQPGFCVVQLGSSFGSKALRQLMLDLKLALAAIHEQATGNTLVYQSVARFDQQTTTKLHRDGGPAESFLMLGYEPSEVASQLTIADYARCAFDLGLSPAEFLAKHNPMFHAGSELLRPYLTQLECFSATEFQIVCINNSLAPFSDNRQHWQGTLHGATIRTPDESHRRVINSTQIATAPLGTNEPVTYEQLQEFQTTTAVRRQGYDKQHLRDDS